MSTKKFCDWCGEELETTTKCIHARVTLDCGNTDKMSVHEFDFHTDNRDEEHDKMNCLDRFTKSLYSVLDGKPSLWRSH